MKEKHYFGDHYMLAGGDIIYVLARVGAESVNLIGINTGSRLTNTLKIPRERFDHDMDKDRSFILDEDFQKLNNMFNPTGDRMLCLNRMLCLEDAAHPPAPVFDETNKDPAYLRHPLVDREPFKECKSRKESYARAEEAIEEGKPLPEDMVGGAYATINQAVLEDLDLIHLIGLRFNRLLGDFTDPLPLSVVKDALIHAHATIGLNLEELLTGNGFKLMYIIDKIARADWGTKRLSQELEDRKIVRI